MDVRKPCDVSTEYIRDLAHYLAVNVLTADGGQCAVEARGGIEVVFYGADTGEEQVRDIKVQAPFGRSMSTAEATNPNLLLCYEMNGVPLPQAHRFPVRLIAPGWYGVANVKWLTRIEVGGTRYEGRFMGRDYVTLREEQIGGQKLALETSVGRTLLASVPARVTRHDGRYQIVGAAWGGQSLGWKCR